MGNKYWSSKVHNRCDYCLWQQFPQTMYVHREVDLILCDSCYKYLGKDRGKYIQHIKARRKALQADWNIIGKELTYG